MLWSMRRYECLLLTLEATQNDSDCLAEVVSLKPGIVAQTLSKTTI